MSQHRLDIPRVAIDFMNRDHDEFATLREQLLARIAEGAGETIGALLDELHAHTRRHFADEEQLMRDTNFPIYPIHKGEHERLLADIAMRIAHWREHGDLASLGAWLETAVGEWLLAHIGSMDTVTAGFAAERQGA
jgi:hemerythrin